MENRTIYALGVLISAAIGVWILAAPLLGLPFGVAGSVGESMEHDALNVWVDVDPNVGDVVVYEQSGSLSSDRIVHRVVDKTDAGYITQGDSVVLRVPLFKTISHLLLILVGYVATKNMAIRVIRPCRSR